MQGVVGFSVTFLLQKGCPMIRMDASGWVFLLVPAYSGSPGPKAVKQLCVYVRVCVCALVRVLAAYVEDLTRDITMSMVSPPKSCFMLVAISYHRLPKTL